ncbi:MAG: MucBP domain-containing protein, partial [Vagococcus sp.]|uniref:MucBP domain-containing protein n=1 Tax=Vagococcus sp. TaxID=1933889 RepID=UPI002FCABD40
MKKIFNLIVVLLMFFSNIGAVGAVSEANSETFQEDYHENSENNGQGYFRRIAAKVGIQNLTHTTSIAFGNQEATEISVPIWQAYPEDKISFMLGANIRGAVNDSLTSVHLHAKVNENIAIDSSVPVQLMVDGKDKSFSWDNVDYDPIQHTIDVELTPSDLGVAPNYTGKFTLRIVGNIRSDIIIGDYTKMPINLTATATNTSGNFVSGVTSLYDSDIKATGEKTVHNLTNGTDKYRIGDTIEYNINYENKMIHSQTTITNLSLSDMMPKGFDYDLSSLKIYSDKGIDISNDPGTLVLENSKDKIELNFSEVRANSGINIVYSGKLTNNFETPRITNVAYFKGIDSATGKEYAVTNSVDLTIEDVGSVTVRHEDEQGKELVEAVVLTGTVGDSYTSEQVVIDGYTYKEVRGNSTGLYTEEPQEVIYVYERTKAAPVTVKYQD